MFFLSLNRYGLCEKCAAIVVHDVEQRTHVITESLWIVDRSTKLDTKLSRLGVVGEFLDVLHEYELMGIPTTEPAPSEVINQVREKRTEVVREGAEEIVRVALAKAGASVSQKTAITAAEQALTKLAEVSSRLTDPVDVRDLERRLLALIHDKRLEGHIAAAEKAEFKGQHKKALDAYREALYLLRTDTTSDAQQAPLILKIEEALERLGEHRE